MRAHASWPSPLFVLAVPAGGRPSDTAGDLDPIMIALVDVLPADGGAIAGARLANFPGPGHIATGGLPSAGAKRRGGASLPRAAAVFGATLLLLACRPPPEPQADTIRVKVFREDGGSVEGGLVVRFHDDEGTGAATLDASGEAILAVSREASTIIVGVPGFPVATAEVAAGQTSPVEMVLPKGAELWGWVTVHGEFSPDTGVTFTASTPIHRNNPVNA